MIGQSTVLYRKSGDAVVRTIAGETLLVPIRGRLADLRQIFSLNSVGARVWELIDGTRDTRSLGHEIADSFAVERDQAVADVLVFLKQLEAAGLVAGVDETPEPGTAVGPGASGGIDR